MQINIEINEAQLKQLVVDEIERKLGDVTVTKEDVSIMVKSKQNYKSEWEQASYKATFSTNS
jgi:hypothetical protein